MPRTQYRDFHSRPSRWNRSLCCNALTSLAAARVDAVQPEAVIAVVARDQSAHQNASQSAIIAAPRGARSSMRKEHQQSRSPKEGDDSTGVTEKGMAREARSSSWDIK